MAPSLYLVTCSEMGEGTHVVGVFPSAAAAAAACAAPHDESACPRSWAWAFNMASEAEAAAPMGAPRPADKPLRCVGHELAVVEVPLRGARVAGDARAWLVLAANAHVGESFCCPAAHGAYTTKEAALRALRLPPTATPPGRGGVGDAAPLMLDGGATRALCRAYAVTGW